MGWLDSVWGKCIFKKQILAVHSFCRVPSNSSIIILKRKQLLSIYFFQFSDDYIWLNTVAVMQN